jgi:hypothetical protein
MSLESITLSNGSIVEFINDTPEPNRIERNIRNLAKSCVRTASVVNELKYVHTFATGGSGTQEDPWTGWVTNTPWDGKTTFLFVDGYFAMESTLSLVSHYDYTGDGYWVTNYSGIRLYGSGNTHLVYTGPATADDVAMIDISKDDRATMIAHPTGCDYPLLDVEVEGFYLDGGGQWGANSTQVGGAGGGVKIAYQVQKGSVRNLTVTGCRDYAVHYDVVWTGEITNIMTTPKIAYGGPVGAACGPKTVLRMWRADNILMSVLGPEAYTDFAIDMRGCTYCTVDGTNIWNGNPVAADPLSNAIGIYIGAAPYIGPYSVPTVQCTLICCSVENQKIALKLEGAQQCTFIGLALAMTQDVGATNTTVVITGSSLKDSDGVTDVVSQGNTFIGGYAAGTVLLQDRVRGTCTLTNGSPATLTLTNHGMNVHDKIGFTTTGTLPAPIAANFVYYVNSVIDTNHVTINRDDDGTKVVNTTSAGSGVHTAYHAGDVLNTIFQNFGQPNDGVTDNTCSRTTVNQIGNVLANRKIMISPDRADLRGMSVGMATPDDVVVGHTAGAVVFKMPQDSTAPFELGWHHLAPDFSFNFDNTLRLRKHQGMPDNLASEDFGAFAAVMSPLSGDYEAAFGCKYKWRNLASYKENSHALVLYKLNGALPAAPTEGAVIICNNGTATYSLWACGANGTWTKVIDLA